MNDLSQMVNLGKVLARKLEGVGISSGDQLKKIGAEDAFARLATIDNSVCINMLYALEGAICGIRWQQLSSVRKKELLEFYHLSRKHIIKSR